MKLRFSEIPDKLKYPPSSRAVLSTLHSAVIDHVICVYSGTYKQRQRIIDTINTLTAIVLSGDAMPTEWDVNHPLDTLPLFDDMHCRNVLGELYVPEKDVIWDISVVNSESAPASNSETSSVTPIATSPPTITVVPTPKEDLYLKPPTVPQMNIKQPWKSRLIDDVPYVIYTSYPEIPKKQNQISCTTDVNRMTAQDLYNLFPNRFIPTRASSMYDYVPTLKFDETLGNIIPVAGYTDAQLLDNLIRYPHIFKLMRMVDGQLISFYSHIEIDGELHKIADVWYSLPESAVIPYTLEYVKEYVVRRYLLERDISHVNHKYPLYGQLDPFLTLFMPIGSYVSFGYSDVLDLAKRCVVSRVAYKQSRNPVLRRIEDA